MIILTATQRLALQYQRQYESQNAIYQPVIMQWMDWLRSLLKQFCPQLQLLTAENTQMLWEKCIQHSRFSENLLGLQQPEQLAQQALQAWNLLKYWHISDLELTTYPFDKENEIFLEWKADFEQQCKQQGWVSDAALIETLLDGHIVQYLETKQIIYLGFDELPPLLNYFFEQCRQKGIEVYENFSSEQKKNQQMPVRHLYSFENKREELEYIARWAQQLRTQQPHTKITIVVNELEQSRALIEEIFLKVFHPEAFFNLEIENIQRAFNISLGRPFFKLPLGATIVQFLRLRLYGKIKWEEVSALIFNAFLVGADTEMMQRVHLEKYLRTTNQYEWSFGQLIEIIQAAQVKVSTPRLVEILLWWKAYLEKTPASQTWAEWNQWVVTLLTHIISPQIAQIEASDAISNTDYYCFTGMDRQLMVCFHEQILSRLERYQLLMSQVSFSVFFNYFRQLTQSVLFQPSGSTQSIQILGLLESAGLAFEHLWIVGLTANTYPPAPKPQLFLPLSLQVNKNMPHATVGREHHFATQILTRLIENSQFVYFSFPRKEQDEVLLPSPLVLHLMQGVLCEEKQTITSVSQPLETEINAYQTQLLTDEMALPLNMDEHFIFEEGQKQSVIVEKEHYFVSGGTTIFRLQARCPFRAFAQLRLRAQPLPLPKKTESFKALRGLIIHQVLETIWQKLGNTTQLKHWQNTGQLLPLLEKEIAYACTQHDEIQKWPVQFIEIEKKQIKSLILAWLEYEQTPPPALNETFQILDLEKTIHAHFCRFQFKVRIDRIQQLGGNQLAIIDYKTSSTSFNINHWFDQENRLQEPQLPLYAILIAEQNQHWQVKNVLVGQVHMKEPKWIGVTEYNGMIKNISFDFRDNAIKTFTWQQTLDYWKKALTQLGNEFHDGFARVQPHQKQVCTYCELTSFCRIQSWHP